MTKISLARLPRLSNSLNGVLTTAQIEQLIANYISTKSEITGQELGPVLNTIVNAVAEVIADVADIVGNSDVVLPTYSVATAPGTADTGSVAYISDDIGGTVIAFFDGTNWRRSTDRAVISLV